MCRLLVYWDESGAPEEGMMSLGQSTLRQLKRGLQHKATSDVMGLQYECKSKIYEESENWGINWDCFSVRVSYCFGILEEKNNSGGIRE